MFHLEIHQVYRETNNGKVTSAKQNVGNEDFKQ